MERANFEVGLVVPLREEFRYVLEIAPQLESISYEGTYFYRLDFGASSVVCCLVDQMGPIPALQAATRLLGFANVKLVVVLGVAGALDENVSVGDVVIATEVNEFQANSKAESAGASYEVRYSGRHWPLEFRIREAISHFEFSSHDAFVDWQVIASSDYEELVIPNKENTCSPPPSLHLGPIASGNVVAASTAFIAEVKRINRKFMAIDMEAAGVVPAAFERIHPLPCLVVRGISDYANEGKKALDEQSKSGWRRYCVRNATSLLRHLLGWEGFLTAAQLSVTRAAITADSRLITELVSRLASCTGGPWIIGVTFGVYSHGPYVSEGQTAIPMDLTRLRVLDVRVDNLLSAADKGKHNLKSTGDIPVAAREFARIVEEFRSQLDSDDANGLLRDFDKVVMEVICPTNLDEQVESALLESDRLEEQVGPEAVIELLGNLASGHHRLRERYIDALARCKMWPEVVKMIREVDPTSLSRLELEQGILAYLQLGVSNYASEMLLHHQREYDDKAAKIFRREMEQKRSL